MKKRKIIVAGNWKMNKTVAEAADLTNGIKRDLAGFRDVDVVLCPPFTALKTVGEAITGTHIDLGAQNMHWEKSGAFTGEVSPGMLRDLYCHYVILGHSERRQYFGETSEIVNKKAKAALASNLKPIVCVGETLEENQSGQHATGGEGDLDAQGLKQGADPAVGRIDGRQRDAGHGGGEGEGEVYQCIDQFLTGKLVTDQDPGHDEAEEPVDEGG